MNAAKEWISPPAELSEALSQQMMALASDIFRLLPEAPTLQQVFTAMAEAARGMGALSRKANEQFEALHPDKNCHGAYLDTGTIMASAFIAAVFDEPDIHPYSQLGATLSNFVRGAQAMEAANNLDAMLDEDDSSCWDCGGHALNRFMQTETSNAENGN